MKVIVDRLTIEKFIKQIQRGGKEPWFRLSACGTHFFIAVGCMVTGTEAIVIQEGECMVTAPKFRRAIEHCAYKRKAQITIEADHKRLTVWDCSMPCKNYTQNVKAPSDFQVFPVTDSWIANKGVATLPTKR